ncbi:transglycosylase domain-containing protein [Anaerobacillus isosaccharinicus]|uniref:Transglycosylase domain-containing protein n=1 Tax=Anaerobacillus isosaccharinicus TaxID=1532552 RepID=A0A1S2LS84_9BACI|nr:transglycosylase domain-containing protein [Anaerobacillus isosaccharinicus]MBA5587982.1 transglycosylase domain-containing protein [Anaerobacillus isosaccharinicus]QOY33871.1 transglycosylase domain-containing protein [Anaerobacillus isosaccharinicus]
MDNKRSDRRFSIQSFVNFLNEKKIFKSFRITYQVVWNLLLIFFVGFISLMLFVGGAGAGFFASLVMNEPIRNKDDMKMDIYNYEEITEIYFADNVFLGDLPSELERREIELAEVSEYLINAIIATEDEYFFEHDGIVPKAILRATYQEFSNSSVQTGGSTLTQQLIKNQILTNEVSFERKAKEILLAMRLENFFEKDEILAAYLNIVPFGRNANGRNIAGVQAAAQGIFGVDAKDLSIPQAAYIAGLPQSPFGYTPFLSQGRGVKENLEPSLNRMRTVLTRMRDKGYISEKEFTDALKYDIRANLTNPTPTTLSTYPFLLDEVERRALDIFSAQMMEEDGVDPKEIEDVTERSALIGKYREKARRDLRRNGYQIHTTVKKEIYDAHQNVIKDSSLFGGVNNLGEPEEVGAILLDNKTGAIISFVGGRDHSRESLNHATRAFRQNGSTMKPMLAYAPAIELGLLQPGFILADTTMYYKNEPEKEITNFGNNHLGLMTAREALQRSRNVPAVKAFNRVPHEYARETLEKMGIDNLIKGEPFEPTAIGGLHLGVSVEQNTNAYSVFANEGKFIQSYMIEKIVSKDGDLIYKHEHEERDIFSEQTAYLTLDMLRDVHVSPGTAPGLPGMLNFRTDLAGKTGTTNNAYDSWYVGFNPNFTMGVWIGYDTNYPLKGRTGPRTQRIWANLANAAYEVEPDYIAPSEGFKMPSGIVRQSFCGISGLLPSELCSEAGLVKTDLFNAKFVPTTVDDSLQRVDFVMLQGEPYRSLETTPYEFTQRGISIKDGYFSDDENIFQFLPSDWERIIPDRYAEDNGKTPVPVEFIRIEGNTLKWSEHPDNDIIGYRIYRAANGSDLFTVSDIVRSDRELTFSVGSGAAAYKVTAVDVAGRESDASSVVFTGQWQDSPSEDDEMNEAPGDDKKKDKEDKKPPKPPGNGNGSNDDDDEGIPDPLDELTYNNGFRNSFSKLLQSIRRIA